MTLKLLWNNLMKYIQNIELKKINFKVYKIKSANIIESKFVPDKIVKYIREHIKYKYVVRYKYLDNNIYLEYFSKDKINTKIFSIIIKRIIFMMIISNTYKSLNIYIYDTPFKKKFSCNNHKKCGNLTHNNVNSGMSYLNNVIIFRKEEYLKLLVHELIHALDIDYKYETHADKKNIYEIFDINSNNLLLNESYVETWAIIINVFLVLYEKNKYNSVTEKNIDLFKKYINKELLHGIEQCSKLCKYYNITNFNDIYKKNKDTKKYNDDVNTFSYHIIKTINLYNINNFLKNFKDSKYVMKSSYNFNTYILFIKKYHTIIINKINITMKKLKHPKNKDLEGLTMSCVK